MKENINFTMRPYQKEAQNEILQKIRDYVKGKINFDEKDQVFKSANLLEMATGSGKTFVTGKTVSHIINVKERLGETLDFGGLNILVLTNRKDGVNQFRDDLIHGRDDKNPIIDSDILSSVESHTFHSSADDLDAYSNSSELSDEVEYFGDKNSGKSKHKLFFSTYQTAKLKNFGEKVQDLDLIIIDEAHNVRSSETEFGKLLHDLETSGRNGNSPMILSITATPDNLTKELFGESIYTFGLPEYLASEYSPKVKYEIITASTATEAEIQELHAMIEQAKQEQDIEIKKEMAKQIETSFEKLLAEDPSIEALSTDIVSRTADESGQQTNTVIFAHSIQEADDITEMINKVSDSEVALSYHSKTPHTDALGQLRDENNPTKVLVVVDKVNESVDLPVVENIVFWRGTDSAKIFLQQFGRGLRGDNTVNYYDYAGSLKNFSWIGDIYTEYTKAKEHNNKVGERKGKESGKFNEEKFSITDGNLLSNNFEISLYEMASSVRNLQESLELTQEEVRGFFMKKDLEYWQNLNGENRRELRINGKTLTYIARIFGVEGKPSENSTTWDRLLEEIFETEILLTQEKVREFFKKKNKNKEYWKNLTKKDKRNLKINGKSIDIIARLFGIKKGSYPSEEREIWYKLLEKILETEILLTQEKVREFFGEDREYWENLDTKSKRELRIHGETLTSVARIFGVEGRPSHNGEAWDRLLEEIFETEIA